MSIAFFISPHGFGHAARASAVMSALLDLNFGLEFVIYTKVPRWFFEDLLRGHVRYRPLLTDLGLVQDSPLKADLSKTVERLNQFIPFDPAIIKEVARELRESRCDWVACDIAPLGIAAAKAAGIRSILIENFTWDWIYEGYLENHPELEHPIHELRGWFEGADYRIQTAPVCLPLKDHPVTRPVSRKPRTPREITRQGLSIPEDQKAVLITMGGIPESYPFLDHLERLPGVCFIIPGGTGRYQERGNLRLLPHHSDFYHPDLVHASDAVIGKVGYSTLAEVYSAGVPFGYVARPDFIESRVLVSFIKARLKGLSIDEKDFYSGQWLSHLPELLAMKTIRRRGIQGADQAARLIFDLMRTTDNGRG